MRTAVDRVTGQLTDVRTRFLGTKPPKLFATTVRGQRSMLALSSRPWLGYNEQGRFNLSPLSYEALDYASGAHTVCGGWGGGSCRGACMCVGGSRAGCVRTGVWRRACAPKRASPQVPKIKKQSKYPKPQGMPSPDPP